MTTAALEDNNRVIYWKPTFMFGDAALDTDQQLLVGGSQWIFTVGGEKYYLPVNK